MAQRAWTPADLAVKPLGWWDAGDPATLSVTGNVVMAEANKGTAGGSAISQTPSNGPIYSATGFSGTKPGITWPAGAAREALRTTALMTATTAAGYAFGAFQASSTAQTRFVSGTVSGTRFDIFLYGSGQLGFNVAGSDKQSGLNAAAGTAHVYGITYNSGGSAATNSGVATPYLNGVAGNTSTYTPYTLPEIGMGTYAGGTGNNWDGFIGEYGFLSYVPSVADRQRLEGYLAWKWGTQARLATSHPYYSGAPMVDDGATVGTTGSVASTLAGIVVATSALLRIAGSSGATLGNIGLTGTGVVPLRAESSATLGYVSAQGAAGVKVSGVAALLPGAITAAASGSIPLRASATSSLDVVSITATGAAGAMAGGVAEVTLGAVTGSSAAFAYLASAASITLGAVKVAALGGWEPSGDYDTIDIPSAHRFVVPARQRRFAVPYRQRIFSISKGTCMSMITKYAAEERQYQADWSADLNGQSIVGEIAAISGDPEMIVDRVTHDGAIMKFWLQGGTPGRYPRIEFKLSTSGGEELIWQQSVSVL